MNDERSSSVTDSWNDANAVLLGATRGAFYSKSGETQCSSFCQIVDGRNLDDVSRRVLIGSVSSVDKTSPHLRLAPPWMHF